MNIENLLNTYSLYMLAFGIIALLLLAVFALRLRSTSSENKKTLFLAIVLVTLLTTFVMAGSTVYINAVSSSKGPVHWHSDFEIWTCGKEVNMKDPTGLSNKIGTATLHEHNDKRVHLEGVVMDPKDASLWNFFRVIGGSLTESALSVPTNEGELTVQNGDMCDGAAGGGQVQVFVYQTDKDGYFAQKKVARPQDYVISPEQHVPPGDCIIVEFDLPKERTDKLCRSYKVSQKIGKLKGERSSAN